MNPTEEIIKNRTTTVVTRAIELCKLYGIKTLGIRENIPSKLIDSYKRGLLEENKEICQNIKKQIKENGYKINGIKNGVAMVSSFNEKEHLVLKNISSLLNQEKFDFILYCVNCSSQEDFQNNYNIYQILINQKDERLIPFFIYDKKMNCGLSKRLLFFALLSLLEMQASSIPNFFVFWTDVDCIVESNFAEHIVHSFKNQPELIAIAGQCQYIYDEQYAEGLLKKELKNMLLSETLHIVNSFLDNNYPVKRNQTKWIGMNNTETFLALIMGFLAQIPADKPKCPVYFISLGV